MGGYNKRISRPQGDRTIQVKQAGFLGGENVDLPISEIDATEVAVLENLIPYRSYLEARPGVSSSGTMPGSGTIWNVVYHSGQEKFVCHRGSFVYVSSDYMATWSSAVTGATDAVVANAASTIREYKNNIIIFQSDRTLTVELDNSNYLRNLNSANPTSSFPIASTTSGDYIYRVTYTYARYVSDVLVAESGPYSPTDINAIGFTELTMDAEWNSSGQVSINNYTAPTGTHWTHVRLYRTLNLGVTRQDNSPEQYYHMQDLTFNNAENYSGQGIGSMSIAGQIYSTPDAGGGQVVIITLPTGDNGLAENDSVTITGTDSYDGTYTATSVSATTFQITATWVASETGYFYKDTEAFTVSDGTATGLNSNDDNLRSRGDLLKSALLTPIPNGAIGGITPGFMYIVSNADATKLNYSALGEPSLIGYYYAGSQFATTDDAIKRLRGNPDSIIILCKSKTYRLSGISVTNAQVGDANLGDFIAQLDAPVLVDDRIGVSNVFTVSDIDQYRFIAVCSDMTVRIFNGEEWGRDLAQQKESKEIRQIVDGAIGLYNPDGFYMLWYSKTDTGTLATNVLRLGLNEKVGAGWCKYTGSSYVYPTLNTGSALLFQGSASKYPKMLCVHNGDAVPYWVETYDGPSGSGYVRVETDRGSAAIATKVRFKEVVGSSEYFYVIHQESHFYLRPYDRAGSYITDTVFSVSFYVDDDSSATDTYTGIDIDGCVNSTRFITGKRISQELTSNNGGFILVGQDGYFRVQDRPTIDRSAQTEQSYEDELAQDLVVWATRPDMSINSANNTVGVANGATPVAVGGPDSNTGSALTFSGT